MEAQKIETAVVVLNWNGKAWLKKFLPTLIKYSNGTTIFLADNASEDNSLDFIKDKFPQIKIILHENNSGITISPLSACIIACSIKSTLLSNFFMFAS